MIGRSESLRAYLARAARTPFAWGRFDCCLFAADWIQEFRGFDIGATWRGAYADSEGAQALIDSAGGLPLLLDKVAAASGLRPTEAPTAGDVGVLGLRRPADGLRIEVAALRLERRWALKTQTGIAVMTGAPMRAWEV